MRKLLFILLFGLISIAGFSQRTVLDTLQGNETVNFTSMQGATQIQATCTQLGGTSDGTLLLQGSVDNSAWTTLAETAQKFAFYPNDTLTITSGATWLIDIEGSPFNYYRVRGAGTASDTTEVTIKWSR